MDDPLQIQLFEEDTGEISPPEERLYLGTSGWSYADWEGTVYPPGIPPAGMLAEYVKHFATVERLRRVVPEGFRASLQSSPRIAQGANLASPRRIA